MSRIRLHKGFYSDELFRRVRQSEELPPISICLIDVDLYESCVPVLTFIHDRLVEGSILLLDDYNQLGEDNRSGERRALLEFEEKNPIVSKGAFVQLWMGGITFRVLSAFMKDLLREACSTGTGLTHPFAWRRGLGCGRVRWRPHGLSLARGHLALRI